MQQIFWTACCSWWLACCCRPGGHTCVQQQAREPARPHLLSAAAGAGCRRRPQLEGRTALRSAPVRRWRGAAAPECGVPRPESRGWAEFGSPKNRTPAWHPWLPVGPVPLPTVHTCTPCPPTSCAAGGRERQAGSRISCMASGFAAMMASYIACIAALACRTGAQAVRRQG